MQDEKFLAVAEGVGGDRGLPARLALIPFLYGALGCGSELFDANRASNCVGGQCPRPECSVEGGGWPADWASLEEQALSLVNERRANGASCGEQRFGPAPAFLMSPALRQSARCHSLDMATQNYFSHESLDGRSPWARIAAAGYTGAATAENIAAGYSDARSAVNALMASTGHCKNIMQRSSNEIGIGFASSSTAFYHSYWTQDFGRR